jgi:predicted nuclease of restriction endonuclease-like (RecB) superfamily
MKPTDITNMEDNLLNELSQLIEQSKKQISVQANSVLTILFWQIGHKINQNILQNLRAEYGKQIVSTVSTQLKNKYGKNFELRNVRRMMQFSEQFTAIEVVVSLSQTLSWSHFVELLPLKSMEAKLFYAQTSAENVYGIRELRKQIASKAFERTKIANAQIIKSEIIPFNTFKDPYILDLLGLENSFLEHDLEEAILKELEKFILELGKGFTFVERQKRMIIDGEDFYLDLLFFHRKLKRLVAIELKIGKFKAQDKGQMELYLKWLDQYEKQDGENTPIGLILCAESSREQIELLEMHKDGIMVAEYWTDLPTKNELQEKIQLLYNEAKERLERHKTLEK